MAIVFLAIVLPAVLKGMSNGRLQSVLRQVVFPGVGVSYAYPSAARAFGTLQVKVMQLTGKTLSVTPGGAYRTYDAQVRAFLLRMSPTYNPITCTLTTRFWNGQKYWLKRGYSPVAAPGTSNHGWGLAFDMSIWNGTQHLGITSDPKVWAVVQEWAPKLGFSWEGAKPGEKGWEPWHIRYVLGDDVVQDVIDMERFFASLPK